MIDCSTLAGLLDHDHGLAAYCLRCDRWAVLPEAGRLQVRPPVPTRGLGGWGESPAVAAMPAPTKAG